LVVYTDPDRKLVRAFAVDRDGETFKVTSQFDLMTSDDPLFRPCQAVQGPDGAIYIADWRTDSPRGDRLTGDGQQGRIYRLSWGGSDDYAEIPLAPLDAWQQIAAAGEDQLTSLLSSDEFELRRRAALELVRRGQLDESAGPAIAARAATIAYDDSRRPVVRAAAIAVAGQLTDATAFEALLAMTSDENPDIQRLAATALGENLPKSDEHRRRLIEALREHLFAQKPGVPRAMFLAHGKAARSVDDAEWAFEATSVTYQPSMGPHLFDAHVRALEMTKDAARELLLGNLDVALNFEVADTKERERLKLFVASNAEAMRTRELAVFLDALFTGEDDLLAKLAPPLQARLIACYRNVQVEPPINTDALATWLEKHPGLPAEVEIAALETMSLVRPSQPEPLTKLAERLLANADHTKEIARRLIAGSLDRKLQPGVIEALRRHSERDSTGECKTLLNQLLTPDS
ncbi:MAG TPA: HEAT repeat domain-containing protein, partial [Pirellulaceae bacterium]|nr:HEAT repeat domain-containing protein [Pirellulaceae bacterium]